MLAVALSPVTGTLAMPDTATSLVEAVRASPVGLTTA